MLFWIAVAFITFLVTAGVVYPLTRGHGALAPEFHYDREIYKARLSEIDNDLAIDRISAEEAEAAKAEEGRRLITSSNPKSAANSSKKSGPNNWAVWGAVFFLPLFTVSMYLMSGAPNLPDQSLSARLNADPERQSIVRLLERAEVQLVKNPDDGNGWSVVAPVYFRLGRIDEAINAYRNSIRILGESPERLSSLGEVLVIAKEGVVTDEALSLFQRAADGSPNDAKSRFFLALALGQSGEAAKAVSAWENLLENAPAQAKWIPVAKANLEAQRGVLGVPSNPTVTAELPGPSSDDIQAAGQMDADQRTTMIEGMVASLAEKLEADPENEAGWRRLIRSYMVLGKPDEARQAITKAKGALPDNADFQKYLDEASQSISNKGGTTQ